jgi:hypothetical protein
MPVDTGNRRRCIAVYVCPTRPSSNEGVINVVLANPEPQEFLGKLDSQGAILQRHARGPDFLTLPLAELLELKRRVPWVSLQQLELLVGAGADVGRKGVIIVPEIRVGAVDHDGVVRAVACFRLCGRPAPD